MNLIEDLKKGLKFKDFYIFADRISSGRFPEEYNIDVFLRKDKKVFFILSLKYFEGRKPFYRKWIEIFNISESFFNSEIEDFFLEFISRDIKGGEKIYIEYIRDKETYDFLFKGNPVYLSRIGFKLLKLSFTWMKDFYFPEGFWEGFPKILAEKALNDKRKIEHLMEIKKEVEKFYTENKNSKDKLILEGIRRSEEFFKNLITIER